MSKQMIPVEQIAQLIYLIRGQKVMLDFDLAALYGVATKVLNQAVKRNRERFPNDFMFQLTDEEMRFSRSQFVTLNSQAVDDQPIPPNWSQSVTSFRKHRGKRYRPFVFTEHKLARKFSDLERRVGKHDKEITAIIEAIRQLMAPAEKPRREIGFHVREKTSRYRVRKRR
jgi:ORF6N domain-containing protein